MRKVATVIILGLAIFALLNNVNWFMRYIYPIKYEDLIIKYSQEYDIDPYLLASVIKVESGFSPEVISKKGATGLMQLMPETAKWAAQKMGIEDFTIDQLKKPEVNIKIGTWYLAKLFEEFNGDTTLALAAYNGGRGNVKEWLQNGDLKENQEQNIPFSETKNFVIKVKKAYKWYKRLYTF
ncbi:MAG TPA: lytic transglycosylase domain-containing protein [Thermoanaerobacterales bacterium]|jgi:soluble lytic murein transglycosylase|nr:lytic transglycosylase domain-containing protein [Thermoanaerobacterales bacterium]